MPGTEKLIKIIRIGRLQVLWENPRECCQTKVWLNALIFIFMLVDSCNSQPFRQSETVTVATHD